LGQVDSVRRDDGADQLDATAAALRHGGPATAPAARTGDPAATRPSRPVAAQAFPGPLRVGAVNPLVAAKRPANTAAATVRTPGRTR
jgi:hypothetical protein